MAVVRPICIGEGGFATIYQCHSAEYERDIAVKALKIDPKSRFKLSVDGAIEQLKNELTHFQGLPFHDHIVKYLGHLTDPRRNVVKEIYFELIPGGTLSDFCADAPGEIDVKVCMGGIFSALSHLKANKVVHNDLSAYNVMWTGYKSVLIDLGVATSGEGAYVRAITLQFRSPEKMLINNFAKGIFTCKSFFASDMWSAGAMFWRLVTRVRLIDNQISRPETVKWIQGSALATLECKLGTELTDEDLEAISEYIPLKTSEGYPSKEIIRFNDTYDAFAATKASLREKIQPFEGLKIDPKLEDLLRKCLAFNPNNRITPDEALLHDYFSDEEEDYV